MFADQVSRMSHYGTSFSDWGGLTQVWTWSLNLVAIINP